MNINLLKRYLDSVFVKCFLDVLLHCIKRREVVIAPAPYLTYKIYTAARIFLHGNIRFRLVKDIRIIPRSSVKNTFCFRDILAVSDRENKIDSSCYLGGRCNILIRKWVTM